MSSSSHFSNVGEPRNFVGLLEYDCVHASAPKNVWALDSAHFNDACIDLYKRSQLCKSFSLSDPPRAFSSFKSVSVRLVRAVFFINQWLWMLLRDLEEGGFPVSSLFASPEWLDPVLELALSRASPSRSAITQLLASRQGCHGFRLRSRLRLGQMTNSQTWVGELGT